MLHISQIKNEMELLMENARLLVGGKMAAEEAAAAFNLLLLKWYRNWREHIKEKQTSRENICNIITLMQASVEKPLSITTLAQKASLSAGRFRQVFKNAMGKSPAAYRPK